MAPGLPLLQLPSALTDFLNSPTGSTTLRWILFAAAIILIWFLARLLGYGVLARVLRARRVETAVVRLLGRLFIFVALVVAVFTFSSILFQADLAALAATLGLVSLALGFGLQNTIANIAGGISLAVDRPFRVGDQIEVGEIVGDVQDIGIRSTRIITRRREYIVLPNKFLEERPIINYTMVFPEIRIDVPISISYDSDRRLAERIMLEVALAHPVVLHKPEPRVVLIEFADSGVAFQLRVWISHPRSRRIVQSDILKAIKDRFDEEGVEIPFPYRTLVYKKDLPAPAREPAASESGGRSAGPRRVLAVTTGPPAARNVIAYPVQLAKQLEAQVVVLYLARDEGPEALVASSRALSAYERAAEREAVWYKPIFRSGADYAAEVVSVAREENVDLIVLPVPRAFLREMGLAVPTEGALRGLGLRRPVHTIPSSASVTEEAVERLRDEIQSYRKDQEEEAPEPIEVSPPEPSTSTVPAPPPETPARPPEETEPDGPEEPPSSRGASP